MRQILNMLLLTFLVGCHIIFQTEPVYAHQPYFEDTDFTNNTPWLITDPTISTAVYGTLSSMSDVDYFTFEGRAGQSILLAMSIPQIEGQDYFAPSITLMGPDLPSIALPSQIQSQAGHGAVIVADQGGEVPVFFEPFSRTRYWRRQRQYVVLPVSTTYHVAVWSPNGSLGRYTFVIGDREIRGGDPAFGTKIRSYWQPVEQPMPAPTNTALPTKTAIPSATMTPLPPTVIPVVMTPTPALTNTALPTEIAAIPSATMTPVALTPTPATIVTSIDRATESRPTLPQPLRPKYGPIIQR